jgi:hypothetical protein
MIVYSNIGKGDDYNAIRKHQSSHQASPAIQVQGKITHLQRRAWNVLLANAYNELPHKEIHSVSVADLAAKLGYDSNDLDYLKQTLEALGGCQVKWNLLDKDKKEVWGVAALLASSEIKDGICTYAFAAHLRPKLHNPRIYTTLNLRLQNEFKGQYALILWEICFDYFDTDRDQGETPFIPLQIFRELMGIETAEYTTFKSLNQRVLKSALKEINALTDYHVEVEHKRIGRKVAELKFRITRVKTLPVQESVFPDIENLSPVALELVQTRIDRDIALKIAKQQWAFVNSAKLPSPDAFPDFLAYVCEKIEMSLSVPNVANRAGYIIEAIRENYQDERVQKARQLRAEKLKEQTLEDLTEAFHVKRNNIVRQAIQADPTLIEKAAERVETYHPRKRLQEYEKATEAYQESPMVKVAIDEVIAKEFCKDQLAPITKAYEDEKARI